jgi:Tol biopolymer transport system component
MTPERYRQINDLADAALELPAERRAAFVAEVCAGDPELRKQIEALLTAESSCAGFLRQPVMELLARDLLDRPQRDLAGRRIGNYDVISRLGAGGIGEVWLARDVNLGRMVALKLLWPKFMGDPYHVRRFQQEARAASALNHPNIVTVYEIGKTEGVDFIAEERVDGETIRQRVARGPIPPPEALEIGRQAATALAAAHAAGVVHRDIKPENVIVRPDGLVKVLDFGLARFVERRAEGAAVPSESLSVPGFVLGTVRYMSPEQARGLPVDGRSDVFSLGVMLYEIATGLPPFSGSTPTDTLAAILTADPAPLSRYAPSMPAEFERIVRRCLAKEPAGRYGSADELRDDLARLALQLKQPQRRRAWMAGAAAGALMFMAAVYSLTARKPPVTSFGSMRITRLETRGEPADAAISPDGEHIAYVARESGGESIWVRGRTGTVESRVVAAEPGEHSGLQFSPDRVYLYYRRRAPEEAGNLYRVRVGGGAPELIIADVTGAASLSPDGGRLAFVRLTASSWQASLIVSNVDGSGAYTLATLRRPRYFDQHTVAWSPDGKSIACFSGEAARYSDAVFHLVEIRLADRSQHLITPQSWAWPHSVAWSPKTDLLTVTAASRGDDGWQLWTVSHRDGQVARLTNDLTNYDRMTVTEDGKTLAGVQSETTASIWVAPGGDAARAARVSLTPLRSNVVGIAWTPDGRIVYSEPAGGGIRLWAIDKDERDRRQLTFGAGSQTQPVIPSSGRYIVYKQAGNLWRADADGSHPVRLTNGALDVHPDISPDGRWVVFASFVDWSPAIGGQPSLWRVPIEGGEPTEIAHQPASYPRVSPDGKTVACIYFPAKDPRFSADHIAVLERGSLAGK